MKEEFVFMSKDESQKLYGFRYVTVDKPVAVLQLIHGMDEHVGRYEAFTEYMADRGFVVYGHDHPGHGKSVSEVSEYGYMGEDPTLQMLWGIHAVRKRAKKDYPDLPFFMLGHSMGSYLLRCYLAKYGDGVTGAVIMGTGYIPLATTAAGLAFLHSMAAVKGWHYRSEAARQLTYDSYYKKFDLTGADKENSWLTRDAASVEDYYNDEKCGFLFTLNGYRGLLDAVQMSCRKKNVERIPKDLPLYLMSGTDDPVGGLGTGVTKVYDMMIEAGIKNVKMKLYEGDRHEILHDFHKEEVCREISEWMEELAKAN
ncbi:MAG: lysophospholipase [Lachnospiraceae bacterium]|nr:lysophospholipase [Lachnospiraceae bacterium]